jgi:hypothetical protein
VSLLIDYTSTRLMLHLRLALIPGQKSRKPDSLNEVINSSMHSSDTILIGFCPLARDQMEPGPAA